MAVELLANGCELLRAAAEANLAETSVLEEYSRPSVDQPAEAIAAELVACGILTPFQTKQLLAGKRRGFILGDKYRVLDLLGVGGMGQVLLCEHLRLRSPVAVKVLPPARIVNPAAVERFYREARVSAALRDEHIVRTYDLDTDGEFHFLVMEYVHGISLQQLVVQHGPLELSRAVEYVRQAAVGLSRIYAAGLVHRDIKPGNIMVDWKGTVTLLDLGLARFTLDPSDDLTDRLEEGAILGTADYIAPEQADASSHVDIRADIYSLGFTLYYLLAGRTPFATGTAAEKVLWHKTCSVDLRDARPGVPTGLATVFDRMVAKDPKDRFQSPEDVAEALAEWVLESVPAPAADELPVLCPLVRRMLGNETPSGPLTSPRSARQASSGFPPRPAAAPRRVRRGVAAVIVGFAAIAASAAIAIAGREYFMVPSDLPAAPRPGSFPDPMTAIDENPDKAIAAELAVSRPGQKRTVRMQVKDRAKTSAGVYLYSDSDPTSPKNFTLFIPTEALPRFAAPPIANPYEFFWGATVLVSGHIVLLDGNKQPGIRVEDPGQILPFHPTPE